MAGFLCRFGIVLLATAFFCPCLSAQEIEGPTGGKIYVNVTRNRELTGSPIELKTLSVTTSFGEVSIPIEKVDGVKLHVGADDSAVIAFKNGDLVTGKVNLETISLKTAWGKAHVNLEQIETIVANRNAQFFPETTNGKKGWRFSNGVTPKTP
jgi:hypothetical protein